MTADNSSIALEQLYGEGQDRGIDWPVECSVCTTSIASWSDIRICGYSAYCVECYSEYATSDDPPLPLPTGDVVAKCEAYAEELFDGDEYFTQVTKWQDGDFRVLVHHGKGHEDAPYRKRAEKVTYRHHDGLIIYVEKTRMIDHHSDEIHESRELERYSEEVRS